MFIPPVGPQAGPLAELLSAMRSALLELSEPTYPHPLLSVNDADLPSASDYPRCPVWVSDLKVIKVSDGSNWVSI